MGYLRVSIGRIGRISALALTLGVVAACSGSDKPLTGQRFAIGAADATAVENVVASIRLPRAVSNAEWTNVNGSAQHKIGHVAFANAPTLRWSTDIGTGVGRDTRITSSPVAGGGLVYTMDGSSTLSALSSDGAVAWSLDLTPVGETSDDGAGGGVSYTNGVLYAGTGFGELLAINAASGTILWRRMFEAAIRSTPTSDGRTVFVVTRGDVAYAIDAKNGALEWMQRGATSSTGGIEGGASPAISGGQLVLPFSSGEIIAVRASTGELRWQEGITGARAGTTLAFIGDISGDPVIDGNSVYASNLAGQTVKLNLTSGARSWTLGVGASDAVWPVGGSVFLVSDRAQLMRVNAGNGSVIWSQQLPQYGKPEKRDDMIRYYGPVLAGGLMWVAGRDGQLRGFELEGGQQVTSVEIPGGAAAAPIVVAGVMYILSLDGELHAFQ
ncbi:MAG: quinoprotein [Rhodobacteraceae bacterium]|nr:MAG: quinoprotein [Paracoccaceae bacterium]